jgi:hypothetical protein
LITVATVHNKVVFVFVLDWVGVVFVLDWVGVGLSSHSRKLKHRNYNTVVSI